MAPFNANSFGILGGDEDDNIDILVSRIVAKAEQAVEENETKNNKKPVAEDGTKNNKSSSDHVKHGSGRPNKNGVERYNGSDNGTRQNNGRNNDSRQNSGRDNGSMQNNDRKNYYSQNNGGDNGSNQNNGRDNGHSQNNGRGGSLRKNNGYYQDNGQTNGSRRFNEQGNAYPNEKVSYVNERPNDRSNGHKPYNRRVVSTINEANGNTKAPTRGNGSQRGKCYSGRRVFDGNHPNGSEVKDGDNNKKVESQGKGGDSAIGNEDGWQIAGSRRSRIQRYRSLSSSVEGKEQSDESKEKNNDGEGVENEVVGAGEVDAVTVKAVDSKESEPEKIVRVVSKEEAEKLAKKEAERVKREAEKLASKEAWETEAKKMTLREYEEKLEKDRKKKLQDEEEASGSLTMEQPKVTRDKPNKGAMVKVDKNAEAQSIVNYFKTAGSNFRRRGGRFSNEGNPVVSLKKADGPKPPSVEDANHFPALGSVSIKASVV